MSEVWANFFFDQGARHHAYGLAARAQYGVRQDPHQAYPAAAENQRDFGAREIAAKLCCNLGVEGSSS